MVGETLNAPPPDARRVEPPRDFCRSICSTRSSRGSAARGWIRMLLKLCALRSAADFSGKAIAYDNRQTEIPAAQIESLRWHPVRLLSFLDSPLLLRREEKISRLDRVAPSRERRYDLFHSLVGRLPALAPHGAEQRASLPSLEIPTWHRDRGKVKRGQAPKPEAQRFHGANAGKKICCCSASVSSRNTISPI